MANISLVNTSWDRKVILILITMLCYIHGAPYGLHGSSTSLACSLLTTVLCGRNCYDLFISCKSRVPDAPHIYLLSSAGFSGERTPSGNICARSLLVISPRNDIHWGWAGTGPGRGISWAAVKFVIKASGDRSCYPVPLTSYIFMCFLQWWRGEKKDLVYLQQWVPERWRNPCHSSPNFLAAAHLP